MKTCKNSILTAFLFLPLIFAFSSCSDSDSNKKDPELYGSWRIKNAAPDVEPLSGKESDEVRLEDSLSNYTFFASNSEIIFESDSVRLTADFMGLTLPLHLPYHYNKNVLTIPAPLDLPFQIQGTVEQDGNLLEFELTPESYMSILQFIHPSFLDEILSATVSYDMQKIK